MTEEKKIIGDVQSAIADNIFTIPNILSIIRIILIIPFTVFFICEDYRLSGIIIVISGITDFLDGFIARKFNQISKLGKCLDPIADKLTVCAVGVCIVFIYPMLIFIVSILIIKDILMLIGGCMLLKKGISPPAAKWFGKAATVVFYIASITLVFMHIFDCLNTTIAILLFAATALLMIYSIFNYYKIFKDLLNKN